MNISNELIHLQLDLKSLLLRLIQLKLRQNGRSTYVRKKYALKTLKKNLDTRVSYVPGSIPQSSKFEFRINLSRWKRGMVRYVLRFLNWIGLFYEVQNSQYRWRWYYSTQELELRFSNFVEARLYDTRYVSIFVLCIRDLFLSFFSSFILTASWRVPTLSYPIIWHVLGV